MARVKVEPGGKVIIAVIVVAAALFLFFEFKPSASRKSGGTVSVEAPNTPPPSRAPHVQEETQPATQTASPVSVNSVAKQYTVGETGGTSSIRVYFAFNRAGINKNVYCIFDRIQNIVRRDRTNGMKIVVEGNADSIGPSWYNVALSRRRAMRVADSLSNRLL